MKSKSKSETVELALMSITSLLTGVEVAHFFSAKLPSTFTIRDFVKTQQQAEYIYDGLVKANIGSAILAGLITVASYFAKLKFWWLPGVTTAGVSGFMTWSYLDDLSHSASNPNGTMVK